MKQLVFCIIVVLSVACNSSFSKYDGYTKHELGYWYKLHSFADGYLKSKNTDYVSAEIYISSPETDSLRFFDTFIIQVNTTDSICLPLILHNVKQGDSISFITPNTRCIREIMPPEYADLFSETKELFITATIVSVNDAITYEQKVKEYNIWLASKLEYEQTYIQKFLASHRMQFQKQQGLYKSVVTQGAGTIPQSGDVVTIRYQGSVLSGEIINHFTSLEFEFGSQWQVIPGIEHALSTMRQGERAVIIVPSDLAWGEKGASDGSIPPFTTVQFDLELVSVVKK